MKYAILVPSASSDAVLTANRTWAQQFKNADSSNRSIFEMPNARLSARQFAYPLAQSAATVGGYVVGGTASSPLLRPLTNSTPGTARSQLQDASEFVLRDITRIAAQAARYAGSGAVIFLVGHGRAGSGTSAELAPSGTFKLTYDILNFYRPPQPTQPSQFDAGQNSINTYTNYLSPSGIVSLQNFTGSTEDSVNNSLLASLFRDASTASMNAAIYKAFGVSMRAAFQHLSEIWLLSCNVGGDTTFIDKMSATWTSPTARRIIAPTVEVATQYFPSRPDRIRLFLMNDADGSGTNTILAEDHLPPMTDSRFYVATTSPGRTTNQSGH